MANTIEIKVKAIKPVVQTRPKTVACVKCLTAKFEIISPWRDGSSETISRRELLCKGDTYNYDLGVILNA